jgi:hypothetical protein
MVMRKIVTTADVTPENEKQVAEFIRFVEALRRSRAAQKGKRVPTVNGPTKDDDDTAA